MDLVVETRESVLLLATVFACAPSEQGDPVMSIDGLVLWNILIVIMRQAWWKKEVSRFAVLESY